MNMFWELNPLELVYGGLLVGIAKNKRSAHENIVHISDACVSSMSGLKLALRVRPILCLHAQLQIRCHRSADKRQK